MPLSRLAVSMSLHRYFKQKSNLPTSSKPNYQQAFLEVNQAVTAALGREEDRNQRAGTKRKHTKSFTPEDRAKIKLLYMMPVNNTFQDEILGCSTLTCHLQHNVQRR